MKSVSVAMASHLAGPVTTLATCWRIVRTDGVAFHFTDHDRDLVFDGDTYVARSGYSRTAIASDAGMAVDNLDVEGVFDSADITEEDLRAGRFDQAEVRIFLINWADPAQGAVRMRRGWFGEVVLSEHGTFRTELRGLTQALAQRMGEVYSPECRADLGDARCHVPIAPAEVARGHAYVVGEVVQVAGIADRLFTCATAGTTASVAPVYDGTIGAETGDGTALFTAGQAWTRAGTVATVSDRAIFTVAVDEARAVDGWFAGGVLTWESGSNAGRAMEVKTWTAATASIELFLPMGYGIQIGDAFRIHPGCDKRLDTCIGRFANVLNFRGEPYVPGADAMMTYPDAR